MDYVLVHGTTQSPSGWERLAAALTRRGHRVVLLDFPTDRPELLAVDYGCIAGEQVAGKVAAPVVVAHSGSGMLLPAIARTLAASELVWLAAVVPDFDGQRSLSAEITSSAGMFNPEWLSLTAPPTDDPVTAAYFLFHDCDLASLRWALSTLRLFHPVAVYAESAERAPSLPPSTYVLPRQDRTLTPAWMREQARDRLGVEPVELNAGHCPHVSCPETVASVIDR